MSALSFESPGRRRVWRTTSLLRLGIWVAATAVLSIHLWGGWPGAAPSATRPRPALPPPLRPLPTSLPALSGEDLLVLAEVRDREPVCVLPYCYLLRRAVTTVPVEPLQVAPEDLLAAPETYRGRPVRLTAIFLRDYLEALPENLAGIREVRTGEVGSPSGVITTFVLPRPDPIGCRQGDDVLVTGYFLQVRRYVVADARGESRTADGPIIIARSVKNLSPLARAPVLRLALCGAAAGALIAAVAVVTLLRQRRRRMARRRPAGQRPDA
jgi:hypothetical protein